MTTKQKLQLHTEISYVKSGFRILGYGIMPFSIPFAALLLITAEMLGIAEEAIL